MTTPYPGYISWTLYSVMLVVIIVRARLFRRTLLEQCFTSSLLSLLITGLLREQVVQNTLASAALLTVPASRQLGTCGITFATAEFLTFVDSLSGMPDNEVKRKANYYRILALTCSIIMLWLGTDARRQNSVIEITGGWDGFFYWAVFSVTTLYVSWGLVKLSIRELRQIEITTRERTIALLLAGDALLVAGSSIAAVSMAFGDALGITDTVAFRLYAHPRYLFFITVIMTALSVSSIIRAVWSNIGLDKTSRRWRQLHVIWAPLVSAFPEVALDPSSLRKSRSASPLMLHRAVVEIRDCILQLRPYTRPLAAEEAERFEVEHSIPESEQDAAGAALQLALALRVKDAGQALDTNETGIIRTTAQSLDDETDELLRLSKWWTAAAEAVAMNRPNPQTLTRK